MAEGHPLPLLEERPLVTFALFAYNQEKFICEAIEGAFSQTYEPLEIILSDDCSTDRTFEIMQTMASSYCGPHNIILNKNEKNLGIGAHVNLVLKMAHGAWIVMAAGDDISLPYRVSKTIQRALDIESPVDGVAVQLDEINEAGAKTGKKRNLISDRTEIGMSSLCGAGLAYSKRTIDLFNDISKDVHNEDVVLAARAFMLSGIGFVSEPLVLYRSHKGNRPKSDRHINAFNEQWLAQKKQLIKRTMAMTMQIHIDSIGCNISKIPYISELDDRNAIATALQDIMENGHPTSMKNLAITLKKTEIIKFWIGMIISKQKAKANS